MNQVVRVDLAGFHQFLVLVKTVHIWKRFQWTSHMVCLFTMLKVHSLWSNWERQVFWNYVCKLLSFAYPFTCIISVTEFVIFQPPIILKPSENQTEQEALEIAITKLLLKSYYDIVRKNIEDSVPKAIMHFLVNFLYSSYEGSDGVCF